MQTTAIDPLKLKLADLEVLEARDSGAMRAIEKAEQHYKPITQRDARQRMIGMMKMINHFSGGDMRQEIDTIDFLVQRIDVLEHQIETMQKAHEAEVNQLKGHRLDEIAGYKKALRNIAARLELYRDPFKVLPFSKWKNEAKGKWMLAVGETIDWAVQRADNQLDPVNAVVIAADED